WPTNWPELLVKCCGRTHRPMKTHVRILAILNIVLGSIGLLGFASFLLSFVGLSALPIAEGGIGPDLFLALLLLTGGGGLDAAVLLLIAGISLLALPAQVIGGIGLLKGQPWARTLMIAVSALGMLSVPIGTTLGIYGLWVLRKEETVRLFSAPAP